MHLGNGIICPATGIPMIAAAAAFGFWAFKNVKKDFSKDKILPLVALSAFVFALQAVNFSIPLTGSSGHIIGALLLAILFGPAAAFLAMTAILAVQALCLADGGLLALGCNIFNMGFLACFVAYPFIYKPLEEKNHKFLGAFLASVVALQLGSVAVVAESALSGSTALNIGLFALLMQSIHFVISLAEGAFTALALVFSDKKFFTPAIGTLAVVLTAFVSKIASNKPDGLEWSLLKLSDSFVNQTQSQIYAVCEAFQAKTAALFSAAPSLCGLVLLAALVFALSFAFSKKADA